MLRVLFCPFFILLAVFQNTSLGTFFCFHKRKIARNEGFSRVEMLMRRMVRRVERGCERDSSSFVWGPPWPFMRTRLSRRRRESCRFAGAAACYPRLSRDLSQQARAFGAVEPRSARWVVVWLGFLLVVVLMDADPIKEALQKLAGPDSHADTQAMAKKLHDMHVPLNQVRFLSEANVTTLFTKIPEQVKLSMAICVFFLPLGV